MPGRHVSLWCLALLLLLAVGAQAARQEDKKSDNSITDTTNSAAVKPTAESQPAAKPSTDATIEGKGKHAHHKHRHEQYYRGKQHLNHPSNNHPTNKAKDATKDHDGPYGTPGPDYEGYPWRGSYPWVGEGPDADHDGPVHNPYPDYKDKDDGYNHYPDYKDKDDGYNRYPDYKDKDDGYSQFPSYKDDGYPYYPQHEECPACPKNTTQCFNPLGGYQCLDTVNSTFSCGACDKVCQANAYCINSTCTCEEGFTDCGGVCVDIISNPNYCGNCSTSCTSSQFCSNGTCIAGPDPCRDQNKTTCFPSPNQNGTCRDLKNDPEACGSCNHKCGALSGGSCTDGKCCVANRGECRAGFQCCGWNILSLLPEVDGIVFATAKCDGGIGFPIIPGRCCKDRISSCTNSTECCEGLECKTIPVFGKQCQVPGCGTTLARCDTVACCAGFICVGGRCAPVQIP